MKKKTNIRIECSSDPYLNLTIICQNIVLIQLSSIEYWTMRWVIQINGDFLMFFETVDFYFGLNKFYENICSCRYICLLYARYESLSHFFNLLYKNLLCIVK